MTALDIIGYYYNSNLTAMKSSKTIDCNYFINKSE